MSAYTVKNMQNNTAGVIYELNTAKTRCEEALSNISTQIANVEDSWKGLAADAMVNALTEQQNRIQAVINRLDSLVTQVQTLSATAASAWPAEEPDKK